MEQLPLFLKSEKPALQPTQPFPPDPLTPGDIDFKYFTNSNLFTTTSHTYVDALTFCLPAGQWFIQAVVEGDYEKNHKPIKPLVGVSLHQHNVSNSRPGKSRILAESFCQLGNPFEDQENFTSHIEGSFQVLRDTTYSIAVRINHGGILYIDKIIVSTNKLVSGLTKNNKDNPGLISNP
jgi:hypothetical protein